MADQPQRASGRAHVVVGDRDGRAVATIMVQRGDEIGFAIGAMNAAGITVLAARPRVLTVLVGQRRTTVVDEALRAVGFTVER